MPSSSSARATARQASWTYSLMAGNVPGYRLIVAKVDPATKRLNAGYTCKTLASLQATLSTGNTVGKLSVNLADTDGLILREPINTAAPSTAPHAMDLLQLQLRNRYGNWGAAWTGVLDEVHQIIDPTSGNFVQLAATTPQKYYEITTQAAQESYALQLASLGGVPGTTVLKYASDRIRSNVPGPLADLPELLGVAPPGSPQGMTTAGGMGLQIDPTADSGLRLWNAAADVGWVTQPNQQSWSAVLQALVANTGLEFFFDEWGRVVWRNPGFLLPMTPRKLFPEDIISLDLAESDQAVVTRVQVRWGINPIQQNAGYWQAPASMVSHLRQRVATIYAPWLLDQGPATALATNLGQMYAANLLIGTVTIPADPLFQVGSLVEIPAMFGRAGGVYYIAAIQYNLDWGQGWVMTLGLRYGRNAQAGFPYLPTVTHPSTGNPLGNSPSAPIIPTINDLTLFTVFADPTLAANQLRTDPAIFPAGSTVQLCDHQGTGTNAGTNNGNPLGPSLNGGYTTLAGTTGIGPILYVQSTRGFPLVNGQAYAYVATLSLTATLTDLGLSAGNGDLTVPVPSTTPPGTGQPGNVVVKPTPGNPKNLAQSAYVTATGFSTAPYGFAHDFPNSFDCSGLVYYSYFLNHYGWQYMVASDQYKYWVGRGLPLLDLSLTQAQLGDLLYFGDLTGANLENQHTGFYAGPDQIYSAMNSNDGIGATTISSFKTSLGSGLTAAISMQGVTVRT